MSEPTQLDRIERMLTALVASWEALEQAMNARAAKSPPSATRGPIDLDSEFGNFVVRKDPPRWKGRSYAGKKLSETEPEFLDALAGFKLWAASKDRLSGDERKAGFNELDADRCAGWAERLRSGWKPKGDLVPDDDIPF